MALASGQKRIEARTQGGGNSELEHTSLSSLGCGVGSCLIYCVVLCHCGRDQSVELDVTQYKEDYRLYRVGLNSFSYVLLLGKVLLYRTQMLSAFSLGDPTTIDSVAG